MNQSWQTIGALAQRFDAADAELGIAPQQSHILQVLKIGEEFGEAAQAVVGVMGTNPRKGHSHEWEHVCDEVADVAITAFVALARMLPNPETYFEEQLAKKAAKFLPEEV